MTSIEVSKIEGFAQALRAKLSREASVVTAASDKYQESIARWSVAAEMQAAIIVFPDIAEDVSEVVKFAVKNHIELVVCGGGHATSGSSSSEGGICIDLSRLNEVAVRPKENIVYAGGGALWGDVDKAAAEHGLAVVGGTVNTTGVGGLTLGGGYGYLIGEYGLVIDNLLEVTIVLANGKIVRATAFKEPSLFWAIRGAGASFGVVLGFTFLAHRLDHPVWGGALVIAIHELDKVVAIANEFFQISDPKSALIWGFKALTPDTFAIVATVFYNGPEPLGTALFDPLLKLQLLANSTQNRSYWSMNTLLNEDLRSGRRRSMKGSAFFAPLDLEFARQCLHDFRGLISDIPDAEGSIMVFEFLPFHKVISVPQNATAFSNRGAYGNLLWIMSWTQVKHDEHIRKWTRDMSSKANTEFQKCKRIWYDDGVTQYGVGEYVNYDGLAIGGPQAFGSNYLALSYYKKKYDPNNVFSKGPKILPINDEDSTRFEIM